MYDLRLLRLSEEGYNVKERQTKAVYKERRKNRDATGDTAGRGNIRDQAYRKGGRGGEKGEEREARAVLTAASEVRRLSNALCRSGIWLLESSARFSATPASSESVLICCLEAHRMAERCAAMAHGEGNVKGGGKIEERRRFEEADASGETWSRASSSPPPPQGMTNPELVGSLDAPLSSSASDLRFFARNAAHAGPAAASAAGSRTP